MTREVLSYCRICAASCGITVTVDDTGGEERVLRVRGDDGHPASRGYTCPKGRGLAAWHHSPHRLDHPRLRGARVGWNDALDDLAAVVRASIDEHGADAVAGYLATGGAYDTGGQVAAGAWLATIGSGSVYTAVTVDNAPVLVAAELVAGHPMLAPVWDPTVPGVLLLVATNPVVSHGYGTTLPDPVRYLREYRGIGGRIWVVDPRRSETAALADEHVAARPGSDVGVLAALARELLADGAEEHELTEWCAPEAVTTLREVLAPFTLERAAREADVDVATLARLLDDLRTHRGHVAVNCGTGATMSADGVLVEWLRWVLLILTGSLDRPGGSCFHDGAMGRLRPPRPPREPRPAPPGPASRPELSRVTRQVPAVALADEIEAGNVRVLVVTGGNPLGALPEPDRLRAALARLDALAVIDVMDGELTALATHVFPATGQLERTDVTMFSQMSVRSAVQATAPVVAPAAERRPMWWVMGALSDRLGTPSPLGAPADTVTEDGFVRGLLGRSPLGADAVLDAGPRGLQVPVEPGWVRETMLPDGRWQLAPPPLVARLRAHRGPRDVATVLAPRREMAWSNSVRYAGDGAEPEMRLHPDAARAAGVAAGDRAMVTSEHGTLVATVAVDANVRADVASLTHGRRGRSAGRLTSASVEVDPLTGMPHASGVPVTVEPGPGAADTA